MTFETVKETDLCKISFQKNADQIEKVIKEYSTQEALQKELEISTRLKHSIQPVKEGNKLIYPFLKPLNSLLGQPVHESKALKIMNKCVEILADLKEQQLVHRDIKPGNLYLDESANVLISDFETVQENNSPSENTCGTPGFMAPEQYTQNEVDWLADQYSLGAVFFNVLSGIPPFKAEKKEEFLRLQQIAAPDPAKINFKLKEPFTKLTMKMLAPIKEERYQSIDEIFEALDQCSRSLVKTQVLEDKVVKIAPNKKNKTPEKHSKSKYVIAAILIFCLLVFFLLKAL